MNAGRKLFFSFCQHILHARELRKNLSSYWKSPFLLLIIIPFHHIVNFPSGFDLLTIVKFALLLDDEIQEIPGYPM